MTLTVDSSGLAALAASAPAPSPTTAAPHTPAAGSSDGLLLGSLMALTLPAGPSPEVEGSDAQNTDFLTVLQAFGVAETDNPVVTAQFALAPVASPLPAEALDAPWPLALPAPTLAPGAERPVELASGSPLPVAGNPLPPEPIPLAAPRLPGGETAPALVAAPPAEAAATARPRVASPAPFAEVTQASTAPAAAQKTPIELPPGVQQPAPATHAPPPDAARDFVRLQRLEPARPDPVTAATSAPVAADAVADVPDPQALVTEMTRPSALSAERPPIGPTATPTLSLSRPAGTPGWDQALGQRIVWMVGSGLKQAELRLDPPHLGSVNVRIAVQDEQAQIVFQAQHPAAREALESALPRLREMLADQGLQLSGADVGGQDGQQAREGGDRRDEARSRSLESWEWQADTGATGDDDPGRQLRVHERSVVDEYV